VPECCLDDYPEFLTPYEVMEILGLGKNKVYELLNQGILKGVRLGKIWRISKLSLKSMFDI
jgi:excisionase family DNA binding protein